MTSLWLVDTREIVRSGSLAEWSSCLSDDERRTRSRGLDQPTREQALVSRGLLRRALSKAAPVAPERWRFDVTEHGRPVAVGPRRAPSFNISHSGGIIVCVIGDAPELGVDVEDTNRVLDLEALARVSFSARELTGLHALAGDARRERFFALWTLKEAYLKARGAGLTLPLDGFTMGALHTDAPCIDFEASIDDTADGWRFARPALGVGLACAIAARQRDPLTVRLEALDAEALLRR